MNKLLSLTAVALLGSTSLVVAQENDNDPAVSGLATENAFSLSMVQMNDGLLELGTVTVAEDCGVDGTVCSIEVYEVTDEALTNPIGLETIVHGGANTDVEVTLRQQPAVDVVAVLRINGEVAARVDIPFKEGRNPDDGDNDDDDDSGNDSGGNDDGNDAGGDAGGGDAGGDAGGDDASGDGTGGDDAGGDNG